ncbi:hypothetical protein [Pseudomonas sp. COW5]|uniref:hypothetical protein n=1 Tax=Pseudomonas sp. COW5 TaxID=2981253 RepID=UPI0022484126|nr:hypothetical protein [Pseudomonas sp. COW5]MCX2545912.1 hypothetical protein [Pseudomonas sp. COW5]
MTSKPTPKISNLETLFEASKQLPENMYYKSTITPPTPSGGTFDATHYFYGVIGDKTILFGHNTGATPYRQFYIEFPKSISDGTHPLGYFGQDNVTATIALSDVGGFYELKGVLDIKRNETEKTITGTANIKGKAVDDNVVYSFSIKFHLIKGSN